MKSSIDRFRHLERFSHLVVHCKRSPFDVYIGRDCQGKPKGVVASWGNPFVMKAQTEEERLKVTGEYEDWLMTQPALIEVARRDLRGKTLGCYCAPLMCHGRVLAHIANSDGEIANAATSTTESLQPNSHPTSAELPPVVSKQQLRNRQRRERKREAAIKATAANEAESPTQLHTEESTPPDSGSKAIDTAALSEKHSESTPGEGYVDIGINITNSQLKPHWMALIVRACAANVSNIMLTGTSIKNTEESIQIAHQWYREQGSRVLYCTAGIHPHYAKSFNAESYNILKVLLSDPFVKAVGECGLDFNRNLSSKGAQIHAFREQVRLACEMQLPLFIHEREAHSDLTSILDEFAGNPPFSLTINSITQNLMDAFNFGY